MIGMALMSLGCMMTRITHQAIRVQTTQKGMEIAIQVPNETDFPIYHSIKKTSRNTDYTPRNVNKHIINTQ